MGEALGGVVKGIETLERRVELSLGLRCDVACVALPCGSDCCVVERRVELFCACGVACEVVLACGVGVWC